MQQGVKYSSYRFIVQLPPCRFVQKRGTRSWRVILGVIYRRRNLWWNRPVLLPTVQQAEEQSWSIFALDYWARPLSIQLFDQVEHKVEAGWCQTIHLERRSPRDQRANCVLQVNLRQHIQYYRFWYRRQQMFPQLRRKEAWKKHYFHLIVFLAMADVSGQHPRERHE